MFKEKATKKIAVQKHFAQKSVSGFHLLSKSAVMRPPLFVYPSFHRLQNTYRVLIQAQHGANKSPVF